MVSDIGAALRETVQGDVLNDPFTRSIYATDASIYEIEPLAVVYPLDELDVRACLRFGLEHRVPVIARGGGSGLAGETLGRGIILDLSVYMNRILELDKGLRQVTVQTGIVLDSLNRALAPYGFRFGPDPSSSSRCTIGGMMANNASGARSLRYGDTRQNVMAARLCLLDGTVTLANPVKVGSASYVEKTKEDGFSGKIHRELPSLLREHAALIEARRPKVERNRSGYLLHGVLTDDVYDLSKLICGSEGTLGIVTQAVLKLEPLPGRATMAVVSFATLLDAARAVPALRETKPAACELLDARLMTLGRQARPDLAHLLPADAKALLILEFDGAVPVQQSSWIVAAAIREDCGTALEARLRGQPHLSLKIVPEPKDQAQMWAVRSAATPLLFRRTDSLQPVPIVEDGAVRPERLAEYLEKASAVFQKHGLEWSAYAHAGSGEVHLRPMMDLRRKEHLDLLEQVAGEIHAAAWACDGTISGEHGEGLARAQWIEKQAGSDLYAVYKEVKALFDPAGLLNPDKKITADPHLMLKNLRFGLNYQFGWDGAPPRLNWAAGELAHETEKCNGCAQCRTTGPDADMCPRFRYARIERAAPRARANILRRLMSGRQRDGSFASPDLADLMSRCFNCKLCQRDCPSGVKIPKLVMEAKARHHAARGLPADTRFFATIETWMRLGRLMAPLANMANETPALRWLMEKTVGIDRRRPLPRLKRWKLRRRNMPTAHSTRPKVVLYTDLFAKYNAPEIAQAAVDVLEHHGFEIEVPDVPWCNMPALEEGAVDLSRAQILEIARVLAPFAAANIPIVTTEPTACLSMREEFLYYVDSPETRALARLAREISEFLMALHKQSQFRTDFRTLDTVYGYNQACHQKALCIGTPGLDLVRLIPGVKALHIDEGCCGVAGTFGMRKRNYDESMTIGQGLFHALNDPKEGIQYGLCESSTCRMQMEHGSGKRTLHPIQVLSLAYGYPPATPADDSWDVMDQP